MTMGPALRFDPSTADPMKNYRIDDKLGLLATSFSEERVLWRDSATLFTFHDVSDRKVHPPATFRWLRELVEEGELERHKIYRCTALGMSKKQAKVFFFREERLPLPLVYLTDELLVNHLRIALDKTGIVAFDLLQAVRRTGMFLQVPDADSKQWGELNTNTKSAINDWVAHTGADRHYWTSVDLPFQTFIVDLTQDAESALVRWYEQLRQAAINAFEQAAQYAGSDGRSFKAVVRGRSYLNYRLSEALGVAERLAQAQD